MIWKNKIVRYALVPAVFVLVTALFFAGGYYIGCKNMSGIVNESVAAAMVTAMPESSVTPAPKRFRLILEDGELRLYSDENGMSRLISDSEISEAAFPARDVAKLKEGVIFDGIGEALEFMENFLS